MRIAALDLGSNSFHLLAVEAHADGTFVPLVREKEMLRLGDVVSRTGLIGPSAAERAVEAVRRLSALAEGVGCTEVVACATSAIREADDSDELVDRIEAEAGIRVRVISGRDEARLIFGAVRASVVLEPSPAICFDLGGGSLEVMVGDAAGLMWSTSVKLGVARLSAELVRDDPPSPEDQRRLLDRMTATLAPLADQVADLAPAMAVGSSGTIADLARAATAKRTGSVPRALNQLTVSRDELLELHERLLAMPAEQRARVAGIEPRRADLLPAGSTLVVTALDLFGMNELTVCEWALREGIVLETIRRHDPADWSGEPRSIRQSSVLALARRCGWNEAHARQVASIAGSLFDQTLPLHRMTTDDREILEHAALLHDIGEHVSSDAHHKHTAYLIEHAHLRGFSPVEVQMLVCLGRYHRNGDPKPSHEPFGALDPDVQERVTAMASILRLADGLDRGYTCAVGGVDVTISDDRVTLDVTPIGDVDLELWGARRKRGLFERLFGRQLEVKARG